MIESLGDPLLEMKQAKKHSLFVVVKVLGKLFLYSIKKNIPHSDQCSHSQQNNATTNTNTGTLGFDAFFCGCYGFSIVSILDGFINVLTMIIRYDLNYDKFDAHDNNNNNNDNDVMDADDEVKRQKAAAIATIINVINVIKQINFKIVADRYVDLVPALIEIVDDRLRLMEDVGDDEIDIKLVAMKILCQFVAYFSYENNPNYNDNEFLSNCNYKDIRKTHITRYLVRKGIIGCICDMLGKITSSCSSKNSYYYNCTQNVPQQQHNNYGDLKEQLSLDMVHALHTIVSFGEKYLKFVSYAYRLEFQCVSGLFSGCCTIADLDLGNDATSQLNDLKQSLQVKLIQASPPDYENVALQCKWYRPVTLTFEIDFSTFHNNSIGFAACVFVIMVFNFL